MAAVCCGWSGRIGELLIGAGAATATGVSVAAGAADAAALPATEGAAAEAACRNCTPALIKELTEINTELLGAIAKRSVLGCLSANQRFHFTLYGASASEVLLPLIESLWLQFGPTMYLSLLSPDMPWDASAHFEILEGLRTAKPAVARRGVLNDIRTTGRSLIPAMASHTSIGLLSSPLDDLYFGD